MRHFKPLLLILSITILFLGCSVAPKFSKKDRAILDSDPLPYVKSSPYSDSLKKLGNLLPSSPYFNQGQKLVIQIKPVANKTACKQLPLDLTDMLKTAGNRVGANLLIAPYDPNYLILEAKTGSGKISRAIPVLVVDGSITECDEKIEEVSTGIDGNLRFGKNTGKTDIKTKEATQKTYSRIALDLHLVDHANHVLLPNKQTSMAVDVWDIKKYRRFGFQVNGSGMGLDGRRKATQERHNAVRALVDLSMLQLLGKYFEVPYWKTINGAKPDSEVLELMEAGFNNQTPRNQLIMVQKMLVMNGFQITPNGIYDNATKSALEEFTASKPGFQPEITGAVYKELAISTPIDEPEAAMKNSSEDVPRMGLPKKEPLSVHVAFVYSPSGSSRQLTIQNGSILRSGDHYKLVLLPEEDCFMYVFQIDSAGRLYMLFPLDELGLTATNPIRNDRPYALPGVEDSFILDDQTGEEKIFLLASRQKDPVVEQLKGYFSGKIEPQLRKQAEEKLGVYLFSKQRVTDTKPGKAVSLDRHTNITANKVESLNNSRIYEFSFLHR